MSGTQVQDSPLVRKAVEDIRNELKHRLRKPLQIVASHAYETVQIHTSIEHYEELRVVAIVWPNYSGEGPVVLKTSQLLLDPDLNKFEVNPRALADDLLAQLHKVRKAHEYL